MDFQQIRKYVKGVLTNSFLNKTTLDKLSTSDAGNLLFDGKEISGSDGSGTSNSFYLIDYNSMESINSRNFTAEKDCYIEVETYANDNREEHYYINDISVGRESINGEVIYLKSFFLSKGDNLKLREGVSHSTTIRIFDLLNNKHNYSTEEQVVGTWIDGKPLYEKVIAFSLTGSGNLSYAHNIENLHEIHFISMLHGNSENRIKTCRTYIPWYNEASVYLDEITTTDILIHHNSNRTEFYEFIIRYTKTTD